MASWAWFQAAEADEASSKEPPQGSGTMEWRSDISIEENLLLELRERDRTTYTWSILEQERKCPWYCIRLTPYAVLVIVECNVLQGSITQSANEKDDLAANNNHTVLRMMQRANEENRIETLRGEGKKHLYRT
jgi:hypothetical protein